MNNLSHSSGHAHSPTGPGRRQPGRFRVAGWLLNAPKSLLIFAVQVYRLTVSPAQVFLFGAGAGCRFTPTCSAYALEAVREHGAATGTVLTAKRLCRCHPWGGGGHDPVPGRKPAVRHPQFI